MGLEHLPQLHLGIMEAMDPEHHPRRHPSNTTPIPEQIPQVHNLTLVLHPRPRLHHHTELLTRLIHLLILMTSTLAAIILLAQCLRVHLHLVALDLHLLRSEVLWMMLCRR